MRTKLHLVSMPWAAPTLPSIQTAALKAHIDSVFGGRVKTDTYSAFVSIVLERARDAYVDHFETCQDFEEYLYFLLCFRRFLRGKRGLQQVSLEKLIAKLNNFEELEEPLTRRKLDHLERRTRRYIDEVMAPRLNRHGVNLVGFTLNYHQLYASIYCARHLRDVYPNHPCVFLFGGATVIYPKVARVLKKFGLEGACVIGEGEKKLESIVGVALQTPSQDYDQLIERIDALHEGIYDIQKTGINLFEMDTASVLDAQMPVEQLPLPDFDEYYASLRAALEEDELYQEYKADTWMALEGTRGCFAHCDFCDVHTTWTGFRKSPSEQVAARALTLSRKYRSSRIKFMDNVCDTWAEKYAEILIERRAKLSSFMECRAHHPEDFWTKLSLSGVELVQVGIEAISPGLIKAMNKGTRARQNVLVQKWLTELGIESLSNLITHHPKSTLQHVRETKRILQLIPHFGRLDFSELAVLIGSPLDDELTPSARRNLNERQWFAMPKRLNPFFVLNGEYEAPREWHREAVIEAWDELVAWEKQFFDELDGDSFMTRTRSGPAEIVIEDGRYEKVTEFILEGDDATTYEACHQGATLAALTARTGLSGESTRRILSKLMAQKLLLELEGSYIALALRPRDELVHNYYRSATARSEAKKDPTARVHVPQAASP